MSRDFTPKIGVNSIFLLNIVLKKKAFSLLLHLLCGCSELWNLLREDLKEVTEWKL
jgi:hypothetical protein